ncbi:MAG TPA: GNAT family N-acetyltransferase [Chthoniobacteraceae bacterium]|nr:GNAT family N-acetyltransferase [Chthoniobacteraceae bacterium]
MSPSVQTHAEPAQRRTRAGVIAAVERRKSEGIRFEIPHATVRVVDSATDIPAETRAGVFAGQAKDFRYADVAARALTGQFEHRYIVLQDKRTGKTAVQPVFFVNQDILEGLPRGLHAALTWPRKFLPGWLRMRMLMVGCSAGDGALDCRDAWFVEALAEALKIYAKKTRASSILFKDFPAVYREALAPLEKHGYRRVPSMPACKLDFNFASFEAYMKGILGRKLRYKYIKLNKKAPIPFEVLTDVTPITGELYELYRQTHERSKMRFERLTPEFFAMLGREMPDVARYFVWRVDGKIAAFALCLIHEGTMYHLNIGFDYSISFDLQLYYVTIRDLFQWAVDQGLKHYVTGQLNYDPKLHLKMTLDPLDLYARHTNSLVNPIFKVALGYLQPVRHDPTIRQFPNFNEL